MASLAFYFMPSTYARVLTAGILLVSGCQSDAPKEQPVAGASVAVAQASVASSTPTVAQRFGPIISGAWVNAGYLAAVQKTKSPLKAFDATGAVSEMRIIPDKQAGDSLLIDLGLGTHEGGQMTVYFRPDQTGTALATNYRDYDVPGSFAELSYQLSSRDTILSLTTYTRNRRVINRASYRRVQGGLAQELGALNQAVDQLLFVGSYVGLDSLSRPVRVQFAVDGSVMGIKNFTKYYTNTDFGGGPGNDVDHLLLDVNTNHQRQLSYSHRADTLRLYEAKEILQVSGQDTIPTLVRGKLLFTLLKQ